MANTSCDLAHCPVTVVIATLGGDSLKETIEALNRGTVVPDEILVCIPVNEAPRVKDYFCPNVKVIVTDCRGQVAQRAVGFHSASHNVVMQLDDDIFVDKYCIEHLLETLRTYGPKVAVAPALMNLSTGKSVYKKPEKNKFLQQIYYWLVNGAEGYQPGKIDKAGSSIGIDPEGEDKKLFDVEWLAGGCVMHYRDNLVLENFYPFTGKAYFEDVIHSYHLRNKGISLKVDSRARCWLESASTSSYGPTEFFRHIMPDYRARKYVMRLYSRSSSRIYLYYFISYLSYVYKRIASLI